MDECKTSFGRHSLGKSARSKVGIAKDAERTDRIVRSETSSARRKLDIERMGTDQIHPLPFAFSG